MSSMAVDYVCHLLTIFALYMSKAYTRCISVTAIFSRHRRRSSIQGSLDENMHLSIVQVSVIASYRDTRSMSRYPIIITQLRPVRPSLDNRLTVRNYRNFESAGVGGRPKRHRSGFMAWFHVVLRASGYGGDQGQNAALALSSDPRACLSTLMIVPRTPIPLRCVTRARFPVDL